jgi:hypothetical protein
VLVGTGGHKNLETHRASKACHTHVKANQLARRTKPNQSLDVFFKPQAPLNPSTVTAPPPIHAVDVLVDAGLDTDHTGNDVGADESILKGQKVCSSATQLLQDLEVAIKQIPDEVPLATHKHPLGIFAVDPHVEIELARAAHFPLV